MSVIQMTYEDLERFARKVARRPKRLNAKGVKKEFGIEKGTLTGLVKEGKITPRVIPGRRSQYFDYDAVEALQVFIEK